MRKNNQIRSLRKIELSINTNLFIICSIVTVAAMVLMTTDFFTRGSFVPSRMNLFYLAVVFIYSIHKELIRWLGEKKIKRRGEYFVYAWIILTTILYIINFFTHDYYSYSLEGYRLGTLRDISLLTIEILGIFIISRVLKLLFIFKK
jgi:hypothetical protein